MTKRDKQPRKLKRKLNPEHAKEAPKVSPAKICVGAQTSYASLQQWEHEFLKDAKADKLALFRDHLRALGLKGRPESLLKGTILVVKACWSYSLVDGYSIAPFLAMQRYNPARACSAKYAFTFNLCRKGRAFARVLAGADWAWGPKAPGLDLADLYGHPCFSDLWITRTDGKVLTWKEEKRLKEEVTDDLLYDCSEDELDIWFEDSFDSDDGIDDGALLVHVQDREKEDTDDLAVANNVEATTLKRTGKALIGKRR